MGFIDSDEELLPNGDGLFVSGPSTRVASTTAKSFLSPEVFDAHPLDTSCCLLDCHGFEGDDESSWLEPDDLKASPANPGFLLPSAFPELDDCQGPPEPKLELASSSSPSTSNFEFVSS